MPIEIREHHSILSFLTRIKQWKPIACPCIISRVRVRVIVREELVI